MTQNCVLKSVRMAKIIKAPAGFVLITYIFARNALAHCTTLLDNNFEKKKKIHKIILDFIVFMIRSTCISQYGGVLYHLNLLLKHVMCFVWEIPFFKNIKVSILSKSLNHFSNTKIVSVLSKKRRI